MDPGKALTDYLTAHSLLSPADILQIGSFFQPEYLRKEETLLSAGNRYTKIVFVAEGILRVFIVDPRGEEVVKNFIESGSFFSLIGGFEHKPIAAFSVAAVTDCTLLTLSGSDAGKLTAQMPEWPDIMKTGALEAMDGMVRKQEFLRIGDSAEQYHHFVKHFPQLARLVPLKYIASYLRITQSSLSRIRRNMK